MGKTMIELLVLQLATVFHDGFEQEDPCAGAIPQGFFIEEKSWQQTWSAPNGRSQAIYPNSIGSAVPLFGKRQTLVVNSFVPGSNQYAAIFWDMAQTNNSIGYSTPSPALAMFVGISECRGDLRPKQFCTRFAHTGSVTWSTSNLPSTCNLEAGRTYFMTISPHDPETLSDMCPDPNTSGCDVQAVHRGQ